MMLAKAPPDIKSATARDAGKFWHVQSRHCGTERQLTTAMTARVSTNTSVRIPIVFAINETSIVSIGNF